MNNEDDEQLDEERKKDLEKFRAFLRSLMMHGAIGTALGGVCTLVGEPQKFIDCEIGGLGICGVFS